MSDKLEHKKRSSSSSRRRRSSTKKSISNPSKQELTSVSGEVSQKSTSLSEETEKPKINYQDELVLIFFNSMLETIIEEWITIPDGPPAPCKCVKRDTIESTTSKDFKELLQEDLEAMEVTDVQGSTISLITKRRKSTGNNKRYSKEFDQHKLQKIEEKSSRSETSKYIKRNSANCSESRQSRGSTSLDNSNMALPICSLELLDPPDERAIIRFKNGNRYEGPVSKLLMHGYGKFIWSNGAVYEGDFIYGDATGKGALTYPDLTFYHGNFCKSFLHDEGVLNISSTPMIYSGQWKAGKRHGKGWLMYEPGNWYDGEWFEDNKQGIGLRQHKSGERYEGEWYQDNRHGQGTCVWSNNDYYKGSWKKGKMHGYGEYTWNTFLNKTFTFPVENTYYGAWINGMRDGVGIMNFGSEMGTRLAGVWQKDQKHGPGVIVCGNGKLIERNPLFKYDKPIHVELDEVNQSETQKTDSAHSITQKIDFNRPTKSTLQLVAEQVYSRRSASSLRPQILQNIAKSQEVLKTRENVVKSSPKFFDGKIHCQPLTIPIHSGPDKIDVSYFVNLAVQKYTEQLYKGDIMNEELCNSGIKTETHAPTVSKYSKWNMLKTLSERSPDEKHTSIETLSPSEYEFKLSTFKTIQSKIEEKYLRNTITIHLPRLHHLYDKYAAIASPTTLKFKLILPRLFLWQLLKDIGVLGTQYSLIDIDMLLMENPENGLESDHHPFEKIYFWQFLKILLTLAWFLHSPSDVSNKCTQCGILATIFHKFLKDTVYKDIMITSSYSIFEYKDLLPIKSVYLLYKSSGEPHTVRKFLNNICPKKGKEPPCYLKVFPDKQVPKLVKGFNAVLGGGNPIFLPEDPPEIGEKPKDPLPEPPTTDPFREELFALRSIGPKKVVECLKRVCPQIQSEGVIVNMEYPLSFIEFYDALLMCVFMVVDKVKVREERVRLREEKRKQKELWGSEYGSTSGNTTVSKGGKNVKVKKKVKSK